MNEIVTILMTRDGMSQKEAEELVVEARTQLKEYLLSGDIYSAYDICEEFFGLEPDYVFELL